MCHWGKSDLYQQDELAEHNIARASPNSQSEQVELQSFDNNSFFKCELSVQNFIIKYCWKMYMFIFCYTAICSYIRRAELQWHIDDEASRVIPLLKISNATWVQITVLYLKPFKIQLRIELLGSNWGESKQNFLFFHYFHLKLPLQSSQKLQKWAGFRQSTETVCLHWNLKWNAHVW